MVIILLRLIDFHKRSCRSDDDGGSLRHFSTGCSLRKLTPLGFAIEAVVSTCEYTSFVELFPHLKPPQTLFSSFYATALAIYSRHLGQVQACFIHALVGPFHHVVSLRYH